MNGIARVASSINLICLMMVSAIGFATSAQAGLLVQGSTIGQFSNNNGGSISPDGQTYSWGWRNASTLDINQPNGVYNFSGEASFEQTVGTLTWVNNAPELLPALRSVDTNWDFSISNPANSYTGAIDGTLHVIDAPWVPDAIASYDLSNLIGQSTDIQHAGGTLTVQLLAPTVSGDGGLVGSGGLFGNVWYNPEGGTSTLSLKARFTNVATAPVVPTPASLSLFAIGMFGIANLRRRRRDTV